MSKLKIPAFGYMLAVEFEDGDTMLPDFLTMRKLTKKDLHISRDHKKRGVVKKWQVVVEIKEVNNE